MDNMTEDEIRENIHKDREIRNAEYLERMQELRSNSIEVLEQRLNENKTLESEIIASSGTVNLQTMTDSEKINEAFNLIERIRLMFEQQELNRIIGEKT
jgi:hypothetical protein